MKKKVVLMTAMAMTLGLAACSSKPAETAASAENAKEEAAPAAEEKKITLKLAGIKSDEDPASQAMQVFAEEVNNNSDTLSVNVYTNSVLGGANDLLSGMTDGTIDMFYNTLSCYPWLSGAEKFTAVSAPFLWSDNAELEAFLSTDEAKTWFDDAAEASGVRCLIAAGELAPRELTSNKPVASAADFKGLKIRTAESVIVQKTMEKLGAQPTVVAFSDLYMALRQGTVDAQENGFMTVYSSSLYEVQDYFMKTDYIRDVSSIFISNELWNSLSEEQQSVLANAAEKAVRYEEATIAGQIDDVVEKLNEAMTYVDIDLQSVQDALGADFYDQFEGSLWPEGTMVAINTFKESYTK